MINDTNCILNVWSAEWIENVVKCILLTASNPRLYNMFID